MNALGNTFGSDGFVDYTTLQAQHSPDSRGVQPENARPDTDEHSENAHPDTDTQLASTIGKKTNKPSAR